jgi:sugar lactone lactonase YvrE
LWNSITLSAAALRGLHLSMNKLRLKQVSAFAAILFALACFFSACTKKTVHPTNTNYNGGGTTIGTDTTGTADSLASFNQPTGLALDAAGNIYVADYGNNLIRKISTTGMVTTLAGNGTQGALDNKGVLASFNGPTGVAVDASGDVYVADNNNNRIRKITSAGIVTTLAGSDSVGALNGLDTAASFFGPSGVAVDASGNVIVADAGNNLIRMVTPAGLVTTLAGSTNAGATNGALLSASFNNPSGVALDASGNIYVADLLNGLIREISPGTGMVTTLAGSDTTASINGTGTAAAFYFPNSLATDQSGNIYVTEYATNLIRKIAPGGIVTTFAGSGAAGQADITGTSATFNGPSGIATDAGGNVYVADTYNNVIRKITPAGVVSTFAGSGAAGALNGKALSLRKRLKLNALHRLKRTNNNYDLFKIFVKRPFNSSLLFRR